MLPKTGWGTYVGKHTLGNTYQITAYVLTMAQKRTQNGRPDLFSQKKHGRIAHRDRSRVPGSIGPGDSEK